eukprot:gene38722-biopygen30773
MEPELLIADEAVSALDVSVQKQVLELLDEIRVRLNLAVLFITHDLRVAAQICDYVAVMSKGRVVEYGSAEQVFGSPKDDYTKALLAAIPRLDRSDRGGRPEILPLASDAPVIAAGADVKVYFPIQGAMFSKARTLRAVDGVSFEVRQGETLGVVGESGSGKSTLARALTLIEEPTGGSLRLGGVDTATADATQRRTMRQQVQMVFQNPYASLNPRKRISQMLGEPLLLNRPEMSTADRRVQVAGALQQVGLRPEHAERYPHMFSGGQRQRIAIARAMMLQPRLLVADEPTSALDVSIQAQILNLFMDLQASSGLAYVFISHNLSVVEHIADRVMVMYLGRVVEIGPKRQIYTVPQHPYTQALFRSIPLPGADKNARPLISIPGNFPLPHERPAGCNFGPRCEYFQAGRCDAGDVAMADVPHADRHASRCVKWDEIDWTAAPKA